MEKRLSHIVFFLSMAAYLWLLPTTHTHAQTKEVPPPTFAVRFGPFTQASNVFVDDFKAVVGQKLLLNDSALAKNWQIVSFRFGWRKKEWSDDAKTGKRKLVTTFNATDVYDSAALPLVWQEELKNTLQPTEELLFEQIIVRNKKTGEQRMANSLLLTLR